MKAKLLTYKSMPVNEFISLLRRLPKNTTINPVTASIENDKFKDEALISQNSLGELDLTEAYPSSTPLCAECGGARIGKKLRCYKCTWKRHSNSINPKRRNDLKRKQQREYHERCRKVSEGILLELFGKDGLFVCQRCGFSSKWKSPFSIHHNDSKMKTGTFNYFIRHGNFKEKLLSENVSFICECCHRLESNWRENSSKTATKRKIMELLGVTTCHDCESSFKPSQYDLHHRDPETKLFGLSGFRKISEKVISEAKKCDLLCANCHQIRHAIYRYNK